MKKFLPKIFIGIAGIAILLAPISLMLEKGKLTTEKQLAQAEKISRENTLAQSTIEWTYSDDKSASFIIKLIGDNDEWNNVWYYNTGVIIDWEAYNKNSVVLIIFDKNNKYFTHLDLTKDIWKETVSDVEGVWNTIAGVNTLFPPLEYLTQRTIQNLESEKDYTAQLFFTPNPNFLDTKEATNPGIIGSNHVYYSFGNKETFSTSKVGGSYGSKSTINDNVTPSHFKFGCGIGNPVGCLAKIMHALWQISAKIATLAAKFLDFFIYYSINDLSYRSEFVEKGWVIVRDIANIFFIIALLYVAIKTILNLNTSNNKKIISSIILVALVINFSLFVTKVVIDTSNVLAKIFYQNITPVSENGEIIEDQKEQTSISVGIIDSFNPQKLVTQEFYDESIASFLFVVILSIFVTLYTAWIFFKVGVLFIGRIVALWLYMIFSPFAFASYTIPISIPGFGHKEWWSELFKNAFLAPLFIFLLYLIILFLNVGIELNYDPQNLWEKILSVIIPFAIIIILITKAKDIAVKLSGEIGKAATKAGALVGGAAVGLAAGGLGFVGRRTIGNVMANRVQSQGFRDWASRNGKFGKMTAKAFGGMASGSFDARGVKILGKDLGSSGLKVNALNKTNKGGFEKLREEKIKKEEEFTKKYLDTTDYGINEIVKTGHSVKEAKEIARNLNEKRRDNRANYLQNKKSKTKQISANKIRRSAAEEEAQSKIVQAMSAFATATRNQGQQTNQTPANNQNPATGHTAGNSH